MRKELPALIKVLTTCIVAATFVACANGSDSSVTGPQETLNGPTPTGPPPSAAVVMYTVTAGGAGSTISVTVTGLPPRTVAMGYSAYGLVPPAGQTWLSGSESAGPGGATIPNVYQGFYTFTAGVVTAEQGTFVPTASTHSVTVDSTGAYNVLITYTKISG